MSSTATVFIDGIDVTGSSVEGSVKRALNRPAEAQVKLPMSLALGGVGSLLKVYVDGVLFHHGRVLLCETDTSEDTGYTVYNSTDPLELWGRRPVRDGPTSADPGDMTKPDIIEEYVTGPQIVEQMMLASENVALIPSKAEGPLFLTQGSFAGGGADLTGAPVDWPMTMAQLATLLVGTGELDIVVTPTELTDSGFTCGGATVYNYGQLDAYNGDYGMDLSSSVAFQYGMGLLNVRNLRWNEDMTNMCNKLWYYLGPRVQTPEDPAGDQHWRANITGDDPGLAYPPGGKLSPPFSATNNQIGVQDFLSRCLYGVRMDVRVYDARGDEATVGRDLYRRLWQIEQWLRAQPQELVHITPTRDSEIGTFDIGDLVLVEAVAAVRGGFSGVQRIYEYTISWDQDSVLALSELVTSPNDQGFD